MVIYIYRHKHAGQLKGISHLVSLFNGLENDLNNCGGFPSARWAVDHSDVPLREGKSHRFPLGLIQILVEEA